MTSGTTCTGDITDGGTSTGTAMPS